MDSMSDHVGRAHKPGRKIIIIVLIVIAAAGLAAAGIFYSKYNQIKKNPNSVTSAQTKSLTDTVSKLITLPSDETPTIATVQDKSKLANQPFFASAQNGDKLLIYTNARKAIIYRPTTNKIINVGPIAIDSSATATPGATTNDSTKKQ